MTDIHDSFYVSGGSCGLPFFVHFILLAAYLILLFSLLLFIHVAAAYDRGCSARSWFTGHRDGTKIIGHEGPGVA